jgi:hypothetical protein
VASAPADQASGEGIAIGRNRLVGHPTLHILSQGAARRVAVFRLRRHRLRADRLQRQVDRRVKLTGPHELASLNLAEQLADVVSLKRWLTDQHAVQRRTQAIDVRPRTQPVEIAAGLLGAHKPRSHPEKQKTRSDAAKPPRSDAAKPPGPKSTARWRKS